MEEKPTRDTYSYSEIKNLRAKIHYLEVLVMNLNNEVLKYETKFITKAELNLNLLVLLNKIEREIQMIGSIMALRYDKSYNFYRVDNKTHDLVLLETLYPGEELIELSGELIVFI
ncbi:hypothetical protein MYP_4316 [Sporocytophaga myxococcoides]|uniref:Uncharacterized protein n=1 Tax=Sporocytophaga myxococcoides TaxID=153721 RepID=A0A098LJC0_9BACT|nr:hypothetical protein [Sporocytophaga myxococcoides]GAL87086.1 hypothetical protein MYP_4316 [Sporocytophaga myxococcoides]